MPKLFIPEIGTDLVLDKDWTFDLVYEDRNSELFVRSGFLQNPVTQIRRFSYYYLPWVDFNFPAAVKHLDFRTMLAVKANDFTDPAFKDIAIPPSIVDIRSKLLKMSGPVHTSYIKKHVTEGNITFDIEGEFPLTCTLPKGTMLKVDRIYIRKGNAGFSSVSFIVVDSPDQRLWSKKRLKCNSSVQCKKTIVRFFAKLNDVNNLEFV